MPGIASAATSVVIGHIAAGTKTIRVGAGGIMLPNHAPYVIAEQFGTLGATVSPAGSTLGCGPDHRHRPAHAARLAPHAGSRREHFPQDVLEVQASPGRPAGPNQRIQPVPAAGSGSGPLWIPGSSNFGADAGGRTWASLCLRLAAANCPRSLPIKIEGRPARISRAVAHVAEF